MGEYLPTLLALVLLLLFVELLEDRFCKLFICVGSFLNGNLSFCLAFACFFLSFDSSFFRLLWLRFCIWVGLFHGDI